MHQGLAEAFALLSSIIIQQLHMPKGCLGASTSGEANAAHMHDLQAWRSWSTDLPIGASHYQGACMFNACNCIMQAMIRPCLRAVEVNCAQTLQDTLAWRQLTAAVRCNPILTSIHLKWMNPAMIELHLFRLGDRTLTVSYAEPKQSEMNQDQVKSVYVGGLLPTATDSELKAFFEGLDNIGEVFVLMYMTHMAFTTVTPDYRLIALLLSGTLLPFLPCVMWVVQLEQVIIPKAKNGKPYSDYGFVHFKDRGSAVKLVEQCDSSASRDPRRLEFPPDSGNFLQVRPQHCSAYITTQRCISTFAHCNTLYILNANQALMTKYCAKLLHKIKKTQQNCQQMQQMHLTSCWSIGTKVCFRHSGGQLLQIKMARPQVKAEQQPGSFAGRGMGMGRGGYAPGGGRGGRGYDQYAYPQGQYSAPGYGGGGYGYDANGGYGYGEYAGGYQQYGAGMQMVPMMLPSGQVRWSHCICNECLTSPDTQAAMICISAHVVYCCEMCVVIALLSC